MNTLTQSVYAAILRILRPLVRVLLRHGIPYGTFADLAKGVYIEVALDEFGIPGRKQTHSRVSVLTGLSRKEVLRVTRLPRPDDADTTGRYNRAARVVTGWVKDDRFRDASGNPLGLPFEEGEGPTFSQLVKAYSGDVPARAILDELLRVGTVEREEGGRIRLLTRGYIPRTGDVDKIGIMGSDVSDLIETIDHNITRSPEEAFFQRKTAYDNLPEEAIPELRRELAAKAQELLEQMDRRLSEHDRDVNPSVKGTGRKRAGFAMFYFEDGETKDRKMEDE